MPFNSAQAFMVWDLTFWRDRHHYLRINLLLMERLTDPEEQLKRWSMTDSRNDIVIFIIF